jgi:quercetin dioxygenase-like cupin family protein
VFAPKPSGLSEAWVEGDETARWSSAAGLGPSDGASHSGSSVLEVGPGCRLPRHTDSAEETIAVVSGRALVTVGEQSCELEPGGLALVPADTSHEVRNAGDEPVVTRYEAEVQPDGSNERRPVG